ncbi:MAG: collagen-like protein [Cytophagales bacterium]|nr:collagen-like protein [Cytophagales bacterium]
MKTHRFLKFLTWTLCAIAFAFVAGCEGPEGPQGPQGPAGPAGPQGEKGDDGTPGVAGNVTCLECHDADNPQAKAEEFSRSAHSAGAIAVDYAGGRSYCAECHSHEGFLEFARTGDVAADIANPSAWECKTCHNIHTTFEQTDYALRLDDAVDLIAKPGTIIDEGNNNLCLNCHQARRAVTYYDKYTEPQTFVRKFTGDDIALYENTTAIGPSGTIELKTYPAPAVDTLEVTFDVPTSYAYISSTHAGPHSGPQGNVWQGVGGVADGSAYDAHSGGCVQCHMGPASGHSFMPKEDNCMVTNCHQSSKEDDLEAFAARVMAVGEKLEELHAIHYSDGAYHPMYASLPREEFNAWWDFMVLLEDRSNGAHNPAYMETLLGGAESALGIN